MTLLYQYQNRINQYLAKIIDNLPNFNITLNNSLKYSLLAPGKRIRPALAYATAELINFTDDKLLDDIAASLEIMHCYSLIHDDLPAMDNDDFRRGIPSCHKKFSEAIAILAGDALQNLSFEILSNCNDNSYKTRLKLINLLANKSGINGMISGQAIDIEAEQTRLSQANLDQMHKLKTGALINAAIMMPAIAANNLDHNKISTLNNYANNIGLLFQIKDDILDNNHYAETLGLKKSQDIAQELLNNAIDNLATYFDFNKKNKLYEISEFILARDH